MDSKLLRGLDDKARRQVLVGARRRRYRAGETVFREADLAETLHLIAKGRVAVRVTSTMGDVATLQILGEGDWFGEIGLLSPHGRRSATVVALEQVETLTIDRATFEELRQAYPSVDRLLLMGLVAGVTRLSAERLEAHYVPAEVRIVRRLLELVERYGGRRGGMVIPTRQEDLATLAGTSRAMVNRVLRTAEDAGCVALRRGKIQVLDYSRLAARGAAA